MAAAADGVVPTLAIRSSVAVELWSSAGPKLPYEHKSNLPREETKCSRSICFSPDGRYFAYSNGRDVKVLEACKDGAGEWPVQCSLPRPKAFYLKFSPRGNYLCTWEHYAITKDRPEGSPNLLVYDITTGTEVFAIVQKNQTNWEPSWSSDETIFALVVGGEALFYDLPEGSAKGFENTQRKIGGSRGGMLSLGPGHCPPYLAFYNPGAKGAPSMCKLYKYPALGQNQTVACKSFFQADRVEMLWNKRGTGLLLLTSTEVDKSGASYYGNQAVHFMATKGDTCSVPLSKEGPVHCVKWSPKATEFVVVYGFMPSKDTTVLEWHPNGEWFVTATTAPRLRISNGFKVYHYSGALLHETMWPQSQELLGIEWQQYADKTFSEPKITKAKHEGIKSSQPEASKKAYTPPHLRLLKEGKNPEKYLPQPTVPGLAPASAGGANNKKNNKNKPKGPRRDVNVKAVNGGDVDTAAASAAVPTTQTVTVTGEDQQASQTPHHTHRTRPQAPRYQQENAGDQQRHHHQHQPHPQANGQNSNEKERKIRTVAKKLSDIKKLKSRQDQGESLELNQLNKIKMEATYLDELKMLKLSD
ncbi:GL24803 [Drosophila persimilis]|uniref:Eukaryotic translation initiation factor 2A n=1 Tax=Drosophila persimilis TaxID=7234 RepID=B4GS57_DROPE|nr:GL24803 [Drosophila persimilis]